MSIGRLSTFAATIPLSLCAATLLLFTACSSDSPNEEELDASTGSASGSEQRDGSTSSSALDGKVGTPGQNNTGGNNTGGTVDGAVVHDTTDAGGTTPIVTLDSGLGASDAGKPERPDAGEGKLCGTRGAGQCSGKQFCSFAASAQCGAADQGGTCKARPDVCEQSCTADGYCGCDGRNYCNECLAARAGTSVAHEGACETTPPTSTGKTCGGIANLQCERGLFCDYEASAGGQGCGGPIADAAGKCQPIPASCPSNPRNPRAPAAPICGCDGKTYPSACEAHLKGESVKAQGACK